MMSTKVVLTYKRRGPPSRFDPSHKNVCLEAPSECRESKASATLDNYEEPVELNRLEIRNRESGVRCQWIYLVSWIVLMDNFLQVQTYHIIYFRNIVLSYVAQDLKLNPGTWKLLLYKFSDEICLLIFIDFHGEL